MFNNRIHDVVSTSSDEGSDSEVNTQSSINSQSSILTRVFSPFSFASIGERSLSEPSVSAGSLVYPKISSSRNAEDIEQPSTSSKKSKKATVKNKHSVKLEKSNDPWHNPIRRRAKALKGMGGLGNKHDSSKVEEQNVEVSTVGVLRIEDLRCSKEGPRLKTGINRPLCKKKTKKSSDNIRALESRELVTRKSERCHHHTECCHHIKDVSDGDAYANSVRRVGYSIAFAIGIYMIIKPLWYYLLDVNYRSQCSRCATNEEQQRSCVSLGLSIRWVVTSVISALLVVLIILRIFSLSNRAEENRRRQRRA
ncbi:MULTISPECIES: hypothetical protein [Candidatus Ichthyocystis]|uniref:hypothetical protein n=1 Tax=Candidatus Ichthyocystis TaxID=2929841 RepID=UPI000B855533|nr:MULTISPECIES: hypothetical protein [Ichthyocystis]